MKRTVGIFYLAVMLLCLSCAQKVTVVEDDMFRFCEAVYPMGDTLLISNFGSEQPDPLNRTDSLGYILSYCNGTTEMFFAPDGSMSAPKGMARAGDYLYVADVRRVHAINVLSGKRITIPLASEDAYANHIIVMGDMLLLSVTDTGHILALDLKPDGAPSIAGFQLLTTVPGANGMLYHDGRLFIASYNPQNIVADENLIYIIDDFYNPIPRPFISRPGLYDGLALNDNNLYFSDWNGAVIGKIDMDNPENIEIIDIALDKPLSGPAEISFYDGKLIIPDLPNSRIIIFKD